MRRARRTRDVTSRNARLSRYARARRAPTRRLPTRTTTRFFFISLNHAHTRVSVDDAFVRSSVRLFDQSIGGARTRFGFFLFPGRPTGVLSLFATRSRSTDANDGAKRNSLYLNPFVSSVRPFVDNRTAFAGIPIDRSVDRSIGTLDPDPRRRRGAKSDFILLGGHSNPWFDTRCNWDYIRISGFMDLECT